ncbi:unnamed protein product [Paramecium sonneborni]|uniref:Uncharacterized protein n=1 Tax=Paramecium sonneborni TaxID=65129 RepID=A0A8S1QSS7_9CILI|nr:unnamed protein product [Paramecium sonneborni]
MFMDKQINKSKQIKENCYQKFKNTILAKKYDGLKIKQQIYQVSSQSMRNRKKLLESFQKIKAKYRIEYSNFTIFYRSKIEERI